MKNFIKRKFGIIAFVAVGMMGYACTQDEVIEPSLSFTMMNGSGVVIPSGGTVKVNELVVFMPDAKAEDVVIWTGNIEREVLKAQNGTDSVDASGNLVYKINRRRAYADYGKVYEGEANDVIRGQKIQYNVEDKNYNEFAYSYPEAGTYTITVIATQSGDYGDDIKRIFDEKQITVVQ